MRIIYLWTATVTDPTPRVKFLNYEIPIKKNIWRRVCVTHQQSLVAPSSRFFLPRLPGQFETVTLRQHQGLYERKWQEQDVQNISTVSGAVPRHVFLHSRVLTWRLGAHAGAFQGSGLLLYLCRGWGKGNRALSVMKAYRFPETKNSWSSAPNEENGDEDRLPVALMFADSHTDAGTVTVGPWERSPSQLQLGSVSGWVSANRGFCGGPAGGCTHAHPIN